VAIVSMLAAPSTGRAIGVLGSKSAHTARKGAFRNSAVQKWRAYSRSALS
jgi:hypothetical protein